MKQNESNDILNKYKLWLKVKEGEVNLDLRGVDLIGANLEGADLRSANLRGAYLNGANLKGADLRNVDLSRVYLRGAYIDERTKFDLNQLTYLSDCNYPGNSQWIYFKNSSRYKTEKRKT